jgi:hypothetical protein
MYGMKYVVIDGFLGEIALIFPNHQNHGTFVTAANKVVAAGFCKIYCDGGEAKVSCFGESVSLGIKSRGEQDAKMIQREFDR